MSEQVLVGKNSKKEILKISIKVVPNFVLNSCAAAAAIYEQKWCRSL